MGSKQKQRQEAKSSDQNILQLIEARKNEFPPKHLKIARYLVSNYEKVAFLPSAQLAEQAGVSQPTVIRFSQALGFSKYQNFSYAFQELIKAELTSMDRFNLSLENDQSVLDGSSNIIPREIRTLTRLNQSFPWQSFDKAVNQIVQAGSVHIIGVRGSASLAHYFGYFLSKVKRHVHIITNGSTEQYDKILNLGDRDLIVAMAFPRYPRETVELTAHCKKHRLKILAITDQLESPLVPLAANAIIIPITFSTIFDSYCSVLCLFNMLITQTGKVNKKESTKLFDEFEELARERQFFTSRLKRSDDYRSR